MSRKKRRNAEQNSMQKPQLGREMASTGDGNDITQFYLGEIAQPSDSVLRNRSNGGHLKIYEQILSDEEVKSSFTQRQDAVTSREWKMEPGGENPIDKEAAEFAEQQVKKIGFDNVTKKAHFGVFYGYSVAELIYCADGNNIGWERIAVRNRNRFRYTQSGELRLLTKHNRSTGEPCHAPYFWHYATGADNDDELYGLGLAHWLYWPVLFKRNDVKFWLMFLDKYGMPTAIGKYNEGATKEQKAMLLELTRAIQTDTGITLPHGMTIELLNATRNGTADYKSLYDAMNDAIKRVVVGQTASSGGTPGRLGNDELQGSILTSIAKSDADLMCESFNKGPITWLTQVNFPGAKPPTISRIFDEPEDLNTRAERDKTIKETTGYRPTLASVKDTYGGEWEVADNSNNEKTDELAAPTEFAETTGNTQISNVPAAQYERTANAMQPSLNKWINQIRELAENVESLEELRDKLDALIPEMTLDEYAEAMSIALSATALAGRYEVIQEAARDI